MVYTVDWTYGFIGGQHTVKVGNHYAHTPLLQAFAELIGSDEDLNSEGIKIVKYAKKRGSRSFGIGTPQSSRDR
jgi:nicotinic acid phosphoribosyltransferase